MIVNSAYADEKSMLDSPFGFTNPSYRISDSPFLRLPDNMRNWSQISPPEPNEAIGSGSPSAVEIYNAVTKDVIQYSIDYLTPSPETESDLKSIPPYQGLLPPGMVPESVFPPDDRVQITSTTSYPWRTVVKLFMTHPSGQTSGCSGAIIDDFHVLTAGHCVYFHDEDGWAYDSWYDTIRVVPGLDDDYMPYYYAWATNGRTYTDWTNMSV